MRRFSVLYEEILDPGFPSGWYYASVPALGLTTHGEGLEGARRAIEDLLNLWAEEKKSRGEALPVEPAIYFGQIDVQDAVQVC